MSTRAAYFFKDNDDHHMVYKHHDGYPTGAVRWISGARALAWAGARFEPDEAAAAFATAAKLCSDMAVGDDGKIAFATDISFNKYPDMRGGGVRLMHKSPDPKNLFAALDQCPDIAYAYVIEAGTKGDWKVTVYDPISTGDVWTAKKIWSGALAKMSAWASKYENK